MKCVSQRGITRANNRLIAAPMSGRSGIQMSVEDI